MSRKRKVGSLANEAAQSALRRDEKMHRRQVLDDLQTLLGQPAGRRFFYDFIMRECQLVGGVFHGEDTHFTAYHEGRRAVGRELMEVAKQECPELYALMVAEGSNAEATETRVRQATHSKAVEDGEE